MLNNINYKKKKIPSSFSLTNCLKHIYNNNLNYINFSIKRIVDQPRFEPGIFVFQANVLTAKLLAHNACIINNRYLNIYNAVI